MRLALYPDEAPGDPGTTAGGIIERAVNMACCEAVIREATRRGAPSLLYTPNLGIDGAIGFAIDHGADVALVIAHNFNPDRAVEGSQFLFCDPAAQSALHQGELMSAIGSRAVAEGLISRFAPYVEAVAWCCAFPRTTIFWEVGFQSNPQDLAEILEPGYADEVARIALDGIAAVFPEAIPRPPPLPPAGEIRWGYFSGVVDATGGVKRRLGPGVDFGVLPPSPIAKGTTLGFDGYTHRGAPLRDVITGQPDDRWFHINAQHGYGWVASALINGNPDF